jgi:hypothetical protein
MKARRAVCPICGGVPAAHLLIYDGAADPFRIEDDETMDEYQERGFVVEDCEPGEAKLTGCQCEERLVAEKKRCNLKCPSLDPDVGGETWCCRKFGTLDGQDDYEMPLRADGCNFKEGES